MQVRVAYFFGGPGAGVDVTPDGALVGETVGDVFGRALSTAGDRGVEFGAGVGRPRHSSESLTHASLAGTGSRVTMCR